MMTSPTKAHPNPMGPSLSLVSDARKSNEEDARWDDLSSDRTLVEYRRLINGAFQISYCNEPGWHDVESTAALNFAARFYQLLAAHPFGPLFRAGLRTTHEALRRIRRAAQADSAPKHDKARIFQRGNFGSSPKAALAIDIVEEAIAVDRFRELCQKHGYVGSTPVIQGEESFHAQSLDPSSQGSPCVLVDIVDGTDSVEQGIGDWCSSMVLYDLFDNRILAAFIGLGEGVNDDEAVFFAIDDLVGKCLFKKGAPTCTSPKLAPLAGPSGITALSESLLAFYGQKPNRLQLVAEDHSMQALLRSMAASPRARVRTQGGHPMMMYLADRLGHRQVDAVFETQGQAPHDVIAGLHIALLAGATLTDLQNRSLDSRALCERLKRPADPASRLQYVLAASPDLANEICSYLGSCGDTSDRTLPIA